MQSDVKDDYKDKKTGKVASVLENRNVIMKCVEMTKNGLIINDRTDKQLRKLIDDSTQKKLESIVNYLYDVYVTNEDIRNVYSDYIAYISDVYCKFVEMMKQQHPDKSVCKADVKRWSDVVELRKKINSEKVADSILLKYLSADVCDSDLMQYAASHVALVYTDSWNNFEVMQQMADETYKALKELRKEIREFSWFFSSDAESVKVMQSEKTDDELIEIKSKLVAYLSDKHTRGKANKKMIRAFRANGVWEFEFQSVNECASHFGVSGVSMAKYIKSGKYISDLGYSFVEIK